MRISLSVIIFIGRMYLPGSPNRLNRKLHEFFNSDIIGDKTKPKVMKKVGLIANRMDKVGSRAARRGIVVVVLLAVEDGWLLGSIHI